MKVLYHHRTASRDGQHVHIRELVHALRTAGNDVTVVSPSAEDDEVRSEMGGRHGGLARLRKWVPKALVPLASNAYELLFVSRVVTAGREQKSDFLYERHALDNQVGLRASRRLDIPLMIEVNSPLAREEAAEGHSRGLEQRLRREIEVLSAADAVLVVTGVLREILIQDGVPEGKIHIVPNGIDEASLLGDRTENAKQRLGLGDQLVLGFIGFPRPWHGLDRVVRAMASGEGASLSDCVLLLGGEGPAVSDLLRLGEELGVRERIHIHGVVDRHDVPAFIDAFDIALQPQATSYASPLKLFEYLARGVPVIAPRQPNIEEVVEDGTSAIFFDPDVAASFSEQLNRLASDEDLRRQIGAAGRQRVIDGGYSWARNADRVIEIAKEFCVNRSPS